MDTFEKLSKVSNKILTFLNRSSKEKSMQCVSEDLFDIVIEAHENRYKLRSAWMGRLEDSIFDSIAIEMRPIPCDDLECGSGAQNLSELRKWRSSFVNIRQSCRNESNSKRKRKLSSLTKKEKKKVNSNWESMRKAMRK